jgi:hypothetical protein
MADNTQASQEALDVIDSWVAGTLPDAVLQAGCEHPALQQKQLRSIWDIISNPARKQTLSAPISIPR